jgi:hypothetical protein
VCLLYLLTITITSYCLLPYHYIRSVNVDLLTVTFEWLTFTYLPLPLRSISCRLLPYHYIRSVNVDLLTVTFEWLTFTYLPLHSISDRLVAHLDCLLSYHDVRLVNVYLLTITFD